MSSDPCRSRRPAPVAPKSEDSPKLLPPEDQGRTHPFRETFLQYFTEPETAQAVRHLGAEVASWVLEMRIGWPDEEGSPLVYDARAVMADLRYLAGHLYVLIEEGYDRESLPDSEKPLLDLIDEMGGRVRGMVDELEEVISRV